MGVSKVNLGDETLIDLTEDTVTPDDLAFGATAHDASGERIQGRDATNAYVTFEESAILENIASGERMGVLFGKLKKWFSKLGGTSISLTNNLLATVAGTALDAVQGKVLKDEITELNDKVNGNILTYNESEDAYYIQHGADAVPKKLQGNSNEPELLISNEAYKSNVVAYENSTSEDLYCIFSLSSFKASVSGDNITLSGCEILKKYYLQTGGLVLGCWYIKIPAGTSFKAQCVAIPNTGYASNALIKIR